MFSRQILMASAFAVFANAQTIETSSASSVAASSTVAQSMPPAATQGFNIGNVTQTELFNFCQAQLNTCPQICGGAASMNQCDPTTLNYSCVCPNGTVPDSSAYVQTIPYFECQQTYIQCIANNPNNAEAQSTCRNNEKCGTRNATAEALAATGMSSSMTASATSSRASGTSGSSTGSASTSATSASSSKAAASVTTVTTGAFMAVLMAAFKLLL